MGKGIVILDDNFEIRQVLKRVLEGCIDNNKEEVKVYTSSDGIEGLGYIYLTHPDLIVIDSTLPKYGGKELVDYLIDNQKIDRKKIIVMHDGSMELKKDGLRVVNKSDKDFLINLSKEISERAEIKLSKQGRITYWIRKKLINWSNRSDKAVFAEKKAGRLKKGLWSVRWFMDQIMCSLLLSVEYLIHGKGNKETNVEQLEKDLKEFRVRAYPTLTTLGVTVTILLLQFILFVSGGLVIFNTRIQSVFALGSEEKGYEFNSETKDKYKYESDLVEFTNGGVRLKGSKVEVPTVPEEPKEESTPEPEKPVEPTPATPETPSEPTTPTEPVTPEPTVPEPPSEEPTTPTEPTTPEQPDNTQGKLEGALNKAHATEEKVTATTSTTSEATETTGSNSPTIEQKSIIRYPTEIQSIETKESIKYSKLDKILERSNINTDETSIIETNEYEQAHKNQNVRISYQLSPDSENWYYFSKDEKRWARTEQEGVSSNTIQEVNENLEEYKKDFASGEIYLRAYLQSINASETPILREVGIERETSLIISENTTLPEEPEAPTEVVSAMDFTKLKVDIFNASYFNGNKVVRGKVLLKDHKVKGKYDISNDDLAKFEAKIYYSEARNATKGNLIGTTELYKNGRGEIEFTLTQSSIAGGYVTAEVVSKEDETIKSELAKPVENSTFTVDSTGDEADASLNGLCATSGGKCTLRAAITEANSVAGSDNIYFNIPTSDTGYRDYDLADTSSSGDSTGGDDYWTIRPKSTLPNITGETHIDGATQTSNQADTNTSGPEIELNGVSAGTVHGLTIAATANNSSISNIIVNKYAGSSSRAGIYIYPSGITIASCYIGTDAKGNHTTITYRNRLGIYVVSTGTGTITNNLIANTPIGVVDFGGMTIDNNDFYNGAAIRKAASGQITRNLLAGGSDLGIVTYGSNATIQGNVIQNYAYGVFNIPQNEVSRIDTSNDVLLSPTIGGSNSLSGSRCGDTQQNCFYNNRYGAIYSRNIVPLNEATIYVDNVFDNYNGHDHSEYEDQYNVTPINVRQQWSGIFEIFSNNYRRTDITPKTISTYYPGETSYLFYYLSSLTSGGSQTIFGVPYGSKNEYAACLAAADCPDQGITNSSNNTGLLGFIGENILSDIYYTFGPWRIFNEYIITANGQKVDYSKFKFDEAHFASQQFSFDGNSTTDPVTTGSARSITANSVTQTYYDRGEPWTDKPNATRNVATADFGRFQIMEVELVDANPVLQDDGSYIITVDSSTNEDNVSTAGYDDGAGAYSGGGSQGPDGLANGQTSLREAIYVANNFNPSGAAVKIHFNIPETDANHKCYQNDNVSGQVTAGNAVTTTTKDDPSCGGTSIDPDYPYSWFDMATTGTYTLSRAVTIDGYTQDGAVKNTADMGSTLNTVIKIDTSDASFTLSAGSTTITGIVITDGTSGITLNSNNNHIQGIRMGIGPSGLLATGTSHAITVNGSGNVIGSDLDGSNDSAEINILNTYLTTETLVSITLNGNNTKINNNYINTDRTGAKTGSNFAGGNAIYFNSLGAGTIGYVEVQSNIIANNQYAIRASGSFALTSILVKDNRMNTSWDGTAVLKNGSAASSTGIYWASTGRVGVQIRDNIIKNYNIAGSDYAFNIAGGGIADNSVIDNNLIQNGRKAFVVSGPSATTRASNLTFSNNRFIDITPSGGTTINLGNLKNSLIDNNTFANFGSNQYFPSINDSVFKRNKFGTNEAGTVVAPIGGGGISFGKSSTAHDSDNNVFGGDSYDDANVFATQIGFYNSDNIKISHNYIGTDLGGNNGLDVPNGMSVQIRNSGGIFSNNIIANTNLDSSLGALIFINDTAIGGDLADLEIKNNCMGTKTDCTTPLPLVGGGIWLYLQYTHNNLISIHNNVIANTNRSNYSDDSGGIWIDQTTGTDVIMHNNKIYNTPVLPINLSGGTQDSNFVTANDAGDTDTGPNNLMNYPVFTSASYMGAGVYHVAGTLDGKASEGPWSIEICESSKHASGHGDCIQTLATVTTDASGNWSSDITISGDDGSQGRVFSSLATNNLGDTSEFSSYAISTITSYPITATYPIDNQQTTDRKPFFDWTANGDPDIDHYQIWLGTDQNNLTKVADNLNNGVTNYTLTDLQPYGTYYWKVVGIRANGTTGGESNIQTFQLVEKLTPLSLIYPTGGIKIDETKPTFLWAESESDNTDYYQLFLKKLDKDETVDETKLVTNENRLSVVKGKTNTTFKATSDLNLGKYEWIVFSNYTDGKREGKSEIGQFELVEEVVSPVVPVLPETNIPTTQTKGDTTTEKVVTIAKISTLSALVLAAVYLSLTAILSINSAVPMTSFFPTLFNTILWFILYRRKNNKWGKILDLQTNKAIAFAQVKLFKDRQELATTYSDPEGNYAFSNRFRYQISGNNRSEANIDLSFADFRIEVKANGFLDKKYLLNFHQNEINKDTNTTAKPIHNDIFLSRTRQKYNPVQELLYYNNEMMLQTILIAFYFAIVLGLVYVIISAIAGPSTINITSLILYLLLITAYLIVNFKNQILKVKTKLFKKL